MIDDEVRLSGATTLHNLPAFGELVGAGRAPQLYAKGHQGGTMSAALLGPGHPTLTLTGWPDASELRLLGIACAVTAVLEAAGRKGVIATRSRTAEGASFALRWQT